MALGVNQPITEYDIVKAGENIEFYFTILGDSSSYTCSYSVSDMEPLTVSFEQSKVIVSPQENKKIYGTILVPEGSPIKTYKGMLHLSCDPTQAGSGSVVKLSPIVDFHPISVVTEVGERFKQPVREEVKPSTPPAPPTIPTAAIFTVILFVVIIIGIGYWAVKKRKE